MSDPTTHRSPEETARLCAQAMWETDTASRGLGMELVEVGPGTAVLSMMVTPEMANGHGTAHGGFIFTLADSAFAFACNSHDHRTVAGHCSISYLRPGRPGLKLVAHAREITRAGRSGIYDVSITQEGVLIAEFRGHSRTIGGSIIAPEDPNKP